MVTSSEGKDKIHTSMFVLPWEGCDVSISTSFTHEHWLGNYMQGVCGETYING